MADLRSAALAAVSRERLLNTVVDVINIPSATGHEGKLAEYLVGRFQEMGLQTRLQPVEDGRPNAVGRLRGGGGGASLLLFGHMDTVWSGSEEAIRDLGPGFQPRAVVDGDWVYGMGAYNMKSGLATVVEAVRAVTEACGSTGERLRGDLILAGVVGETCRVQVEEFTGADYRGLSVGAHHLVTGGGVLADFAVMAEPTSSLVSAVAGGFLFVRVSATAKPGASYLRSVESTPDPEKDAIEMLAPLVARFPEFRESYRARHRWRGLPAGNATIIALRGGFPYRPTKRSPFARAYVELTHMAEENELDLYDEFVEFVRACQPQGGLPLQVDLIARTPGVVVTEDEPGVQALLSAHESIHGSSSRVTADARPTDAVVLHRLGIPSVAYGPQGRARAGGINYYTADGEQCNLDDLLQGAKVFASLAVDFCSRDAASIRHGRAKM